MMYRPISPNHLFRTFQEFLQTLDPPITLDKKKLTRWHPEFDVDSVPDIVSSPLPLPPNVEKFSTAKDVLSKLI